MELDQVASITFYSRTPGWRYQWESGDLRSGPRVRRTNLQSLAHLDLDTTVSLLTSEIVNQVNHKIRDELARATGRCDHVLLFARRFAILDYRLWATAAL